MSTTARPSVFLVLRVSGSFFSGEADARVDTGIPQFSLEQTDEPLMSQEAAEALAERLMLKDGILRWVFKSTAAGAIKQACVFEKTNGAVSDGGSKVTSIPRKDR